MTLTVPVVIGGKALSKLSVVAVFQQIEEVERRMTEAARPIDADEPWKSADAQQLDDLSVAAWLIGKISNARAIGPPKQNLSPTVGCRQRRELSGRAGGHQRGRLENYWTENEAFHCVGGNQPTGETTA